MILQRFFSSIIGNHFFPPEPAVLHFSVSKNRLLRRLLSSRGIQFDILQNLIFSTFQHEGASASVSFKNGKIAYVDKLWTKHENRNQGDATRLFQDIFSFCDIADIEVHLDANPYGVDCWDRERLLDWYRKRGFIETGEHRTSGIAFARKPVKMAISA